MVNSGATVYLLVEVNFILNHLNLLNHLRYFVKFAAKWKRYVQ